MFVDCNREDLCLSFADFEAKVEQHRPRACVLVHIGGHLAFETERIAELLPRARHLPARGLRARPRRRLERQAPGTFGDAGVYSLYATKTVSTGEGGVLVSRRRRPAGLRALVRDYGKPDYDVAGLNFRMSEFTAALGLVQIERTRRDRRLEERRRPRAARPAHPGRLQLPDGMISGLYKYVVFDPIEQSSGKVYDQPCHRIMGTGDDLPNTRLGRREPLVRPALLPPAGGSLSAEAAT